MFYILIFVALIGIYTYLDQKKDIKTIKRNGIKATGVIIENREAGADSGRRLGGNINEPVVRFTTNDGRVITGKPVVGFTSQYEVVVPHVVNVVYNASNPNEFYIDFG